MTSAFGARVAPLTGVIAVLLLVGALILEGQPPDAGAATEDVVRFYSDNDARLVGATLIGALAAVWFGGSVFATLRGADGESGHVSATAFGGLLLAGRTGDAVWVWTRCRADRWCRPSRGNPDPGRASCAVLRTVCCRRACGTARDGRRDPAYGALPRWLGYVTIVIAVVSVIPAGFGAATAIASWLLATTVWVFIVSVVTFLRKTPTQLGC